MTRDWLRNTIPDALFHTPKVTLIPEAKPRYPHPFTCEAFVGHIGVQDCWVGPEGLYIFDVHDGKRVGDWNLLANMYPRTNDGFSKEILELALSMGTLAGWRKDEVSSRRR